MYETYSKRNQDKGGDDTSVKSNNDCHTRGKRKSYKNSKSFTRRGLINKKIKLRREKQEEVVTNPGIIVFMRSTGNATCSGDGQDDDLSEQEQEER